MYGRKRIYAKISYIQYIKNKYIYKQYTFTDKRSIYDMAYCTEWFIK